MFSEQLLLPAKLSKQGQNRKIGVRPRNFAANRILPHEMQKFTPDKLLEIVRDSPLPNESCMHPVKFQT